MGIFNFSSLRDALGGVKGRLSELNKDIAYLEQDRAALVALPLPYLDFCDFVETRYDHLADQYPRQVRQELLGSDSTMRNFYMSKRIGHETLADFMAVFNGNCPIPFERPVVGFGSLDFGISEKALFFIFRDAIKQGIRRVLDETVKPDWPKEVGPPRKERVAQLHRMETKLAELISDRDHILKELAIVTE